MRKRYRCNAITTLEFWPKQSRKELAKVESKLAKIGGRRPEEFPVDHGFLSLYESLSLSEAASFSEKLDSVIDDWVRIWKKVGGRSGIL
jgi:hypothetical protein